MALLPTAPGAAGSLCSHLLGLGVSKHDRDARAVTVGGEIDALTAPELAACLAEQLSAVSLVVLDLNGVQFIGSAGLAVLFEANERATRKVSTCVWYATLGWLIGPWTRRNYESSSRSPTRCREP
jgi:ABC-type transporter Mla MlaB component